MKHLTVEEFIDFVSFEKITPESLKLASKVNTHIAQCAECMNKVRAFQSVHDELVRLGNKSLFGTAVRDMWDNESDEICEKYENRDNALMLTEEIKNDLVGRMTVNLPVLRKKLKLSQEELGNMIGCSRYTVMQTETGKRKMTWGTFMSLAFLFDKNEDTSVLLRALDIYTDQLDGIIKKNKPE